MAQFASAGNANENAENPVGLYVWKDKLDDGTVEYKTVGALDPAAADAIVSFSKGTFKLFKAGREAASLSDKDALALVQGEVKETK